jgi:glycosyltransferase involved in cell wall biosynthesis
VSTSQRERCPAIARPIATIPNGVDLEVLQPGAGQGGYALALGRICPEKGFDRAIDAAKRAGVPLLLAGEVFGYPEHLRYFETCLVPRFDASRQFIGPVGRARKRELMAGARAVLVPSSVAETSSLVAMEALACGTPVITFGAGALAEIVEHGCTGFIVADEDEMAAAITSIDELDRGACRRAAEQRFSARRMAAAYLELYARLCAA